MTRTLTNVVAELPTGSNRVFLQHAEELGLSHKRHTADLVQETCPHRLAEPSPMVPDGSRESALHLTKSRFPTTFPSVRRSLPNEGARPTVAMGMNGVGDDLLTGSAFAA